MYVDKLKILRGRDIPINDWLILHQPTIGEISDFGEREFFGVFYSFCSIPSDIKSSLWDAGIDFMKISDWQLFLMLSRGFDAKSTSLIFGDLDFSKMEMMKVKDTEDIVLTDGEHIVDEELYLQFIGYVRDMIGYIMKREKAANKFTKQILIDEDRKKRLYAAEQNKEYSSTLLPLILSLVNTEEFSYNYEEVFQVTIYQLMRSYYQIQNKKSACALYQGSMSGFVDTSKISQSAFQWIYDEEKFK